VVFRDTEGGNPHNEFFLLRPQRLQPPLQIPLWQRQCARLAFYGALELHFAGYSFGHQFEKSCLYKLYPYVLLLNFFALIFDEVKTLIEPLFIEW